MSRRDRLPVPAGSARNRGPSTPRRQPPEPNAEDETAAAESGGKHDAEYFSEMRVTRNVTEWEAARGREAERQRTK